MCAIGSAGWVVRVSRPEAEAMDPVYAEMVGNAGLFFMVVIGSFLAALLFSRRISSPLGQLRNHAMVLKAGKYTDKIELRGVREIEVLAQAFNSMAEQIRRREEQLDKWAEDALKKKAEMEAVFSSMSNAVIIYDSHGNVARANPAALEAYGFDIVKAGQAELAKRIRIRHADQSPLSIDSLPSRRALLGEKVLGQRLIITDETGNERVILTSASPLLLDEKPFGAVVVWQDNTELEKLHQQIEYRNRLLQGVIDHAPARIAIFDAKEPRMILANQAFRDALEDPYRSESLQGIRLEDYIPAAKETGLFDIFKRVASTGQAHFDPEYEFLLSGREKSFWNWSLVPLRGPEGAIEHLLLTAVDVTDQVKQKEALRKARDNLDLLVQERTAQLQVANTALLDYTRQLEAKNKELADFSFWPPTTCRNRSGRFSCFRI
jgi:PAS domain-containing protein